MTLSIVSNRPATDPFSSLGVVADAHPHPSGTTGDDDSTVTKEFRTALASALSARADDTPRNDMPPAKRPRGAPQTSDSSTRSLVSAGGATREGEVHNASGEEHDDTGLLLAADSRTTFIGSMLRSSPTAESNSAQQVPFPLPPPSTDSTVTQGERSGEDGAAELARADGAADAMGFVAASLEVATAALAPFTTTVGASSVFGIGSVATHGNGAGATEATGAPAPNDAEARPAELAATMGRDPMSVRRDLESLSPELRGRLERIIDRMQTEFGYQVEVIETTRTQERQDALFAQGRTTSGPVVTWTRASNHIDGHAADVIIDGNYGNPQAYERLARVARDEGVRTLWPRDPGHVELPPSLTTAGEHSIAALARRAAEEGVRALPVLPTNDGVRALPMPPRNEGVHTLPMPPRNDGVRTLPMPPTSDGVHALPIPHIVRSGVDPSNSLHAAATTPSANAGGQKIAEVRTLPLPARLDAVGQSAQVGTRRQPAQRDMILSAAPNTRVSSVTGVAQVATIAQVAATAQVATVARVARVGDSTQTSAPAPSDVDGSRATTIVGSPMRERDAGGAPQGGERNSSGERRDRETADALLRAMASPNDVDPARAMLSREVPSLDVRDGLSSAPVAGLSRSDATERIARVLRMQESAGDRPLSSVLLRLDHPEGGEDRIRIDLRGHSVGATLDMSDPRAAEQLRVHASELQQALQRQGLEGEAMVVRSAPRYTDSAAYSLSAGAADREMTRAASATAPDGGGSTAKDSRNQPRAQHEREGTDQQRSRQRRDGKGEQK